MHATKILQSVGLKASDTVFSMNNEEAIKKLLEFITEWDLQIKVKRISKDDWKTLF